MQYKECKLKWIILVNYNFDKVVPVVVSLEKQNSYFMIGWELAFSF